MSEEMLMATSLVTCMENSQLSATNFDVVFTPGNRSVAYNINANVEISGRVSAKVTVVAYGFSVITQTIDPCTLNLPQLCPFNPGQVNIQSHTELSQSVVDQIPSITYNVPDIDATVYVEVMDANNNMVACIQVDASNGKSVNHVAVKWVTAVISGIGLLTSAIVSTLGNSYTAAHIATNALALFAYFQSVVIITMEAVDRVPPMASAWAQNLAWSMGLIDVKFMQDIFRWYIQSTGGTPTLFITNPTIAVLVQKRAKVLHNRVRDYVMSSANHLLARQIQYTSAQSTSTLMVLRGIKRVGFQAGIEQTSIVLTGFTFFVLICFVLALIFALIKLGISMLIKMQVLARPMSVLPK